MPGYRATEIRIPSNETEFEKNCVVLFRELLNDPNVKRLGRRGQGQQGVDLIGYRDGRATRPVGVQCKLKTGRAKLKPKEVRDEVKAALAYRPKLAEYYIVATSGDDIKLDQLAAQLAQEQAAIGRKITIQVWGWNTLQEKIDQSEAAKQAFDPGFSPSIASMTRKLDAVLEWRGARASKQDVNELGESIVRTGEAVAAQLPSRFADRELREMLSLSFRRRGFARTDTAGELATLARRATSGDLVHGSSSLKAEVCDRAARSNACLETLAEAKRFRDLASQFDPARDLSIANALIKEAEGDGAAALRELRIRTDAESRSALFMCISRQRSREDALKWFEDERLKPDDLRAFSV